MGSFGCFWQRVHCISSCNAKWSVQMSSKMWQKRSSTELLISEEHDLHSFQGILTMFLFCAVCCFSAGSNSLHHLFTIKMPSRCLSLTPFSSTCNRWRTVDTYMGNMPDKPHEIFFAQIFCVRRYFTWCENLLVVSVHKILYVCALHTNLCTYWHDSAGTMLCFSA